MRLLIATGETVKHREDLPAGIATLLGAASEILVMSPSLVGRLEWLTGGVDAARHVAEERLTTVLDQLASTAATVQGVRGDELLRTAFDDAVGSFHPDHVVIVAKHEHYVNWERQRVLQHLLNVHRLAVTIFTVDD